MRKLNKTAEEILKSAQEIIAWNAGDWAPKDAPYDGEAICLAIDRFLKDNKKVDRLALVTKAEEY